MLPDWYNGFRKRIWLGQLHHHILLYTIETWRYIHYFPITQAVTGMLNSYIFSFHATKTLISMQIVFWVLSIRNSKVRFPCRNLCILLFPMCVTLNVENKAQAPILLDIHDSEWVSYEILPPSSKPYCGRMLPPTQSRWSKRYHPRLMVYLSPCISTLITWNLMQQLPAEHLPPKRVSLIQLGNTI